jgi:hypothetical protein
MPHDAQVLRRDIVPIAEQGDHDSVITTSHIAPADGDGGVAYDPHKEYDLWAAQEVMTTLRAAYPGHEWRVIHDSHQGMCLISIPILMGLNNFMAVNLKTHAMDSHRAIVAGGEILERYGLMRGKFQLAPFLEARDKHSALVVRSRKVPG